MPSARNSQKAKLSGTGRKPWLTPMTLTEQERDILIIERSAATFATFAP